jgi:acyl carrier protein
MNVHEKLEDVFKTVFNNEDIKISDSTTANDIPGWDSVAHINLMLSIEQTFNTQFSSEQFLGFDNVGELKGFLSNTS